MAGGARISVLSSDLGLGGGNRGRGDLLTIYFTGASKQFGWWGPGIYQYTCDWKGCPHLLMPEGGKFGV